MLQHRLQMAGLAAVSLFAGLLFFALLRPQGIGLEFYFPSLPAPRLWLPPVFLDSFPSFIHTFAHTLACFAVLGAGRLMYTATSALLLASTIGCELYTGVYDPIDIVAAVAGTLLALLVIELRKPSPPAATRTPIDARPTQPAEQSQTTLA